MKLTLHKFIWGVGIALTLYVFYKYQASQTWQQEDLVRHKGEASEKDVTLISKATFNGVWPFTVDSGNLRCVVYEHKGIRSGALTGIVFEANGKTYAVNGMASSRSAQYGYRDLKDIWAVDTAFMNSSIRAGVPPEQAKLWLNMGDVTEAGLKLCK